MSILKWHAVPTSPILHAPASDDDVLSVIELDESLADVEKPIELPASIYTGEVQDVQVQDSQKGNRYFAIKFVIPPEEIAADIRDEFPDGAVLYWNRNIVPSAKDRRAKFNLRKLIEALGLDSNTSTIDPNEWMGCKARLRVVMGKYQGEERAEIKSVDPAERAAPARGKDKPAPARNRAAPIDPDGGSDAGDDRRPAPRRNARGR